MKKGIKKFISGLNDAIADKLSFGQIGRAHV